jgi:hypothetical protein
VVPLIGDRWGVHHGLALQAAVCAMASGAVAHVRSRGFFPKPVAILVEASGAHGPALAQPVPRAAAASFPELAEDLVRMAEGRRCILAAGLTDAIVSRTLVRTGLLARSAGPALGRGSVCWMHRPALLARYRCR